MSYLPLIDLKNGFWPEVHLLYGVSEWNFTDMLTIKGYILWVRIATLTFPDCELSTLDWSENWFWPVVHFIRPCSLFPIDNLSIYAQNFFKFCIHIVIGDEWYGIVFWPVILLLFMISEWIFTDMLNSKGYILQRRTVTLTFPVHELSSLD